jgi:class 3 adenylate cyclase
MNQLQQDLERYDQATDADRPIIEQEIWRKLGTEGSVLVLDMAEFSLSVRRNGVVHYLALIRRMQRIVSGIAPLYQGQVLEFTADNAVLLMKDSEDALRTAIAIHRGLAAANAGEPAQRQIKCAIGIAHGRLLIVPGEQFAGDCVNIASKLGEDLAKADEILIEESSYQRLPASHNFYGEPVTFTISGFDLAARNIRWRNKDGEAA